MGTRPRIRICSTDSPAEGFWELPLTFEGERVFAIWDYAGLGQHRFEARIELDPRKVKQLNNGTARYRYAGKLVLPRPQDN